MIHWVMLISRQGKVRLAKWYESSSAAARAQTMRDVVTLVLPRAPKMCNVVDWRARKLVYRRYASLYFVAQIDPQDNELLAMELLHMYVEVLDQYFTQVCELDLIFNFTRAYWILDEMVVAGELLDCNKQAVISAVGAADVLAEGANPEFGPAASSNSQPPAGAAGSASAFALHSSTSSASNAPRAAGSTPSSYAPSRSSSSARRRP
jgi:AP-1 complex subunit sigma 1/2